LYAVAGFRRLESFGGYGSPQARTRIGYGRLESALKGRGFSRAETAS